MFGEDFGVVARAVERDIIKGLYRKLKLEYVEKVLTL